MPGAGRGLGGGARAAIEQGDWGLQGPMVSPAVFCVSKSGMNDNLSPRPLDGRPRAIHGPHCLAEPGSSMSSSALYIVATPIGNLQDISARALDVLRSVDLVACEDTRHTAKLLNPHGIEVPLMALHEHNESQRISSVLDRLSAGESVALVSDAGTPLISDPGYRLVSAARLAGHAVVAVPGPSAVTAALSVSGLPTDRFVFEGFLPARSTARRKRLDALAQESRTLVFYESSHRIEACLQDMLEAFGPDRQGAVCREMTKQFESFYGGRLADIAEAIGAHPDHRRGEFVVLVGGAEQEEGDGLAEAVALARQLTEYLPASQAARVAARIAGVSRRAVYERLGDAAKRV